MTIHLTRYKKNKIRFKVNYLIELNYDYLDVYLENIRNHCDVAEYGECIKSIIVKCILNDILNYGIEFMNINLCIDEIYKITKVWLDLEIENNRLESDLIGIFTDDAMRHLKIAITNIITNLIVTIKDIDKDIKFIDGLLNIKLDKMYTKQDNLYSTNGYYVYRVISNKYILIGR